MAADLFDAVARPPELLNLKLPTDRWWCNYRCKHCHLWTRKADGGGLTDGERIDLIEQFARLNPRGVVVLAGGEPMMDLAQLLMLAGACKQRGLRCSVTTNGSYVTDEEIARTLAASGLTRITVSLDSHIPEIHRYTRGVPTAFEDTTRAIRLLVAARGAGLSVAAACVLFDQNVALLRDYVLFCRELGVDGVDFQLLSPTFANVNESEDFFFERHFFSTPEAKQLAAGHIAAVIREFGDGFLLKGEADLEWIRSYIADADFKTATPVCRSHEKYLLVDVMGRAALCHNNQDVLPDAPFIGDVRTETLAEIWAGATARRARSVMDRCVLGCGALNCHR
jgi:MoaA/NifB/PqqE/SkfB family radical SAM enzyme